MSKHQGSLHPAESSVKTGLFEETWGTLIAQPSDYDITVVIKIVWRIKNVKSFWKTNSTELGDPYFLYATEK